MNAVCAGTAVLSVIKIKVPNRKTYRPMPIFDKRQITAMVIYRSTANNTSRACSAKLPFKNKQIMTALSRVVSLKSPKMTSLWLL